MAEVETQLQLLEPRLRRVFVARYGWPAGLDVAADVMEWAWEHRAEIALMTNPAGYLYRVGTSRSRRMLRWRRESALPITVVVASSAVTWTDPALPAALNSLRIDERTAIVLVHCFQWPYNDVSEVLGVPLHTVRNLVHRGLKTLRVTLGDRDD